MICPPLSPAPVVQDWLERHRRPASFALHMIGIPPTLMGALMVPIYLTLLSRPVFVFALSLFVGGYLIQFLGHALDGSEPGEVAYLRRKIRHFVRKRLRTTIEAAAASRQTPGPVA